MSSKEPEGKAWEDMTLDEKLEGLGFDEGSREARMGLALDAFSDTLQVIEEIEEIAKAASDPSENQNVVDAIVALLKEE
jgi:hypothetical protein